jgi:hypothetical protein
MADLKQHQFLGFIAYLTLWLLLCVYLAIALWQLHISILYLAALVIGNPALRPVSWSSATLAGISKLSAFSLISLLMVGTMYMEYKIRQARDEGSLLAQTGRYALIISGILLLSLVMQWIPA